VPTTERRSITATAPIGGYSSRGDGLELDRAERAAVCRLARVVLVQMIAQAD
jgi:hypothetical protein